MTPSLSTPAAAAVLRSRGFALCKPDRATKLPSYTNWPTFSLEAADFNVGDQIGIMGGSLSHGGRPGHALVIVDLDSPEALREADRFLPTTKMIEGRTSKPRSHRYYLVPFNSIPDWGTSHAAKAAPAAKAAAGHPGPAIRHFFHCDTDKGVLDFIGTGGQVVAPPSMHPSQERREWVGDEPGEPAIVEFMPLWESVCRVADACGCDMPDALSRPWDPKPTPRTGPPRTYTRDQLVKRIIAYLDKTPGAVAKQRGHDKTFTVARSIVWGFDISEDEGLRLLLAHWNEKCTPPWSEQELRHKCHDADVVPFDKLRGYLRDEERPRDGQRRAPTSRNGKPPASPRNTNDAADDSPLVFTDTDIANGRQFVVDHGDDVRFVADWSQWCVFDGKRWMIDRSKTLIESRAKDTANRMAREAAELVGKFAAEIAAAGDNEEVVAPLKKSLKRAQADLHHAKKTADMRAINRMLAAARSEGALCVPVGDQVFDHDRDLLNCPNGTVELRTGALREHRRGDFITKLCPTAFHPNAPRSTYLKFLDTVFDGAPTVATYIRQLSGYVITGDVSDQTLNILNGDGSNGKNVLVNTWRTVLGEGEYCHSPHAELLVDDQAASRHPTELCGLRGCRLAVCSETGEEGELDETKMKRLTGGDTVSARYMRGDFFTFLPTHKIVLLTNNKPRVKGTDHGVWRRIRLVPFVVKFWKDADKELDPAGNYPTRFRADPDLEKRMIATEAAGVLADMVENAAAFYRGGKLPTPPVQVLAATADYRADQDVIGQFFTAKVRESDNSRTSGKDLHAAFKTWWEEQGYDVKRVPGMRKFGAEASRKFKKVKASGVLYCVRVVVADEWEDGRMGGNSNYESTRARAQGDLISNSAPILPSSHERDRYADAERDAIQNE